MDWFNKPDVSVGQGQGQGGSSLEIRGIWKFVVYTLAAFSAYATYVYTAQDSHIERLEKERYNDAQALGESRSKRDELALRLEHAESEKRELAESNERLRRELAAITKGCVTTPAVATAPAAQATPTVRPVPIATSVQPTSAGPASISSLPSNPR